MLGNVCFCLHFLRIQDTNAALRKLALEAEIHAKRTYKRLDDEHALTEKATFAYSKVSSNS